MICLVDPQVAGRGVAEKCVGEETVIGYNRGEIYRLGKNNLRGKKLICGLVPKNSADP